MVPYSIWCHKCKQGCVKQGKNKYLIKETGQRGQTIHHVNSRSNNGMKLSEPGWDGFAHAVMVFTMA